MLLHHDKAINRVKMREKKKLMITSINAEKLFDKNTIALYNKNFQQVRKRGELFQSIKEQLKKYNLQIASCLMLKDH